MKYLLGFAFFCTTYLVAQTPQWSLTTKDGGWNSDFLTKTYFHNSELQRQWAWEVLGRYAFSGSEKVLDFGCGDGKITAELARLVSRGGTVLGVDMSKEMIAFSKKKFPQFAYPNLQFLQTGSLTFDDAEDESSFDLVTSFCVFHLVANPKPLLVNIKKQLKKNGTLLITIPAGNTPAFFQAAEEMFEKYALKCPWNGKNTSAAVTMRSVEGARNLLKEADFHSIDVSMNSTDTAFYDIEELTVWMTGTLSANWNIPIEKSYAFFGDVIQKMIELCPECVDAEGRVLYKCDRVHVIAKA